MSTTRRDMRTSGDLVMAPRVPHGLAAAVEGLTREVIRHRPEDIYVFAAQHFEELLKLRDEYGAVTNLPGKSTNTAALREMNKSLKKRTDDQTMITEKRWSMNETARVLERHRSIFGDKGKKVTPEEVRALGNEKENKSKQRNDLERFVNNNQKRRGSNERFVRRKIPPKNDEESKSKSDSNGNPKIISQIPTLNQSTGLLVKDIKSELRKNRNSSRDGKSIRERAEKKASDRTERLDIGARISGTSKQNILNDNQKKKTESFSKMPRTLSMDRVREYVMEKFRSSESCEELRSTNYVDRVQEVIDEASPSILSRVKELSIKSAGRNRGYESVDESTSTSTRSDKSNQTDDLRSRSAMSASRRSRRSSRRSNPKSKSKISCADSLEGIETLASETEQSRIETEKKKNAAKSLSGESDLSDYPDVLRKVSASSSISLPAVRPPSSKNQSRSVSRSDSDNLVLPPIPPEVPKSAKLREELVLPSLLISKEVIRGVETVGENILRKDGAEVEFILPDPPTDEIFKDSLNVTPDIAPSPRADSLEPNDEELVVESNFDEIEEDEGIEKRLREIEETEKRIEKILRNEAQENTGENHDAVSVKEKLIEIQEAEERLSNILNPHVHQEIQEITKDVGEIGMKEKLMEIEESEKRIEKILDSDAQELQEHVEEVGMKEKLMEIEETEKRIQKIFDSEAQEVQEDVNNVGMEERLMEIEETEKRIEKIFDPKTRELQEDIKDVGMKEKLIEIEETEKRIEKILQPEAEEVDHAVGMKEKLIEITEAEKRLENVFNSTPGKNEKLRAADHNSAPKTPFIPEIPSEYVTTVNEVNASEEEAKNTEETVIQFSETNSQENTKPCEPESRIELISSGTPDSLGNSYVLTEGSPYEIPDSVTTVIIPERLLETPSSDVFEIVAEDDVEETDGSGKNFGESSREISLRNILDNFGEIVHQDTTCTSVDVDYIKDLKTSNDVVINRKDLGLITEEDDKDIPENEVDDVNKDTVLHDIVETEEILEIEDAENLVKGEMLFGTQENPELEIASPTTTAIGSLQQNVTDSTTTESTDEVKETTISDDGGNTAAESSVTLPSCGEEIGARNSESSNEVKETTISDQPADQIGKNLFSLVPQCYGSMPHVPELNLDSLQDITVSSFQLSDDATAGEDSDVAQPQSGTETSVRTGSETHESRDNEEVSEEIIIKEQVSVEEDPCTKEIAYVTEPVTEGIELKDEKIDGNQEPEMVLEEEVEVVPEEILREVNKQVGEIGLEEAPEKKSDEAAEEVAEKMPGEKPEEVVEKISDDELEQIVDKVSDEDSKLVAKTEPEEVVGENPQEVHEKDHKRVARGAPEQDPEELAEEVTKTAPGERAEEPPKKVHVELVEEVTEIEPQVVLEKQPEGVHVELVEEVSEMKPEEVVEKQPDEVHIELVEEVTVAEPEEVVEKQPEEVHVELVEESTSTEPAEVVEKQPDEEHVELVEESTLTEPAEVVEKQPEEVHEELVEEVTLTNPEDVVKEQPEGGNVELVQTASEGDAKEVLENVPDQETEEPVTEVAETEPKEEFDIISNDIHEDLVGKLSAEDTEDGKLVEEVVKTEPEEVHEDLTPKVLEGDPEEIVEAIVEGISEQKSEELVDEVAKTEPEEVLKEESGKTHDDLVRKVPEKDPEENSEEIVETVPEQNSDKLVEQVSKAESEEELDEKSEEVHAVLEPRVSEEDPENVAKDVLDQKTEKIVEEAHQNSVEELEKNSEGELVEIPKKVPEEENPEVVSANLLSKDPEEEMSEPVSPIQQISESETKSLQDFKTLEASVDEEYSNEINNEVEKPDSVEHSVMRAPPEVSTTGLMTPEPTGDVLLLTSDKAADIQALNLEPPKAEVVTNDLERTEYHIYVPDVTASEDYSTTESSTFNSAATKIQAGVRGFLTRRRLQSAQRRSSTLDSVPSIQDSFAADAPHLEPIEEVGLAQAATTIQSGYRGYKARQRLRREDAVQKTTMSVDNLFCGNGVQHTGEFHDCLPLPLLQDHGMKLKPSNGDEVTQKTELQSQESTSTTDDQESLGLLAQNHYPFPLHQGLNVVVLSGNDAVLQSQYLNFITSIEEVHNETESLDQNSGKKNIVEGFSTMKSNTGIESLPMDDSGAADTSLQNSNISMREPLAVPGTPTTLIIEELSKTEDGSIPGVDNKEGQAQSLDLPGLSLEDNQDLVPKPEETNNSLAPDASLGTMSFSMNVDDMLGLGGESEPAVPLSDPKMKPILEVTVTPRDLLKLTNRSRGSQASADRVESPVTMMQIVPKSVDDKSERSEDEGKDRTVEDKEEKKSSEVEESIEKN